MIYIIWSMDRTLIVGLEAFASKKKALELLAKYQADVDGFNEGLRFGMYIVPHAKSQKQMAENITRYCI